VRRAASEIVYPAGRHRDLRAGRRQAGSRPGPP